MIKPPNPSRRLFLAGAGGLAAAAGTSLGARAATSAEVQSGETVPFWGDHQGGIVTPLPQQAHTYFAAFDLTTPARADVVKLLRIWTEAAAKLTGPQPTPPSSEAAVESGETIGDVLGLGTERLTLTFGFGPGLFEKEGSDRYGLAKRRPEALVDLPRFNGDQLVPEHTGGDISIQACADDPQVAYSAIRTLARLAYDIAEIRWVQTGFMTQTGKNGTPRNLMGFKDGSRNPRADDPEAMQKVVWVGEEGPDWMRGGSYVVARRIRIALEHWDRTKVSFQEEVVGRHKYSGAPLGQKDEFATPDFNAADKDDNPIIPESAHVRLAAPETNDGALILRRPYSYNDGVNFTAERWPPWRQGMQFDSGLFFICYQRDPRTGFIKIFENMAKIDMMNQFTTHVGGGLFAVPGGVRAGEFIGQGLFESA